MSSHVTTTSSSTPSFAGTSSSTASVAATSSTVSSIIATSPAISPVIVNLSSMSSPATNLPNKSPVSPTSSCVSSSEQSHGEWFSNASCNSVNARDQSSSKALSSISIQAKFGREETCNQDTFLEAILKKQQQQNKRQQQRTKQAANTICTNSNFETPLRNTPILSSNTKNRPESFPLGIFSSEDEQQLKLRCSDGLDLAHVQFSSKPNITDGSLMSGRMTPLDAPNASSVISQASLLDAINSHLAMNSPLTYSTSQLAYSPSQLIYSNLLQSMAIAEHREQQSMLTDSKSTKRKRLPRANHGTAGSTSSTTSRTSQNSPRISNNFIPAENKEIRQAAASLTAVTLTTATPATAGASSGRSDGRTDSIQASTDESTVVTDRPKLSVRTNLSETHTSCENTVSSVLAGDQRATDTVQRGSGNGNSDGISSAANSRDISLGNNGDNRDSANRNSNGDSSAGNNGDNSSGNNGDNCDSANSSSCSASKNNSPSFSKQTTTNSSLAAVLTSLAETPAMSAAVITVANPGTSQQVPATGAIQASQSAVAIGESPQSSQSCSVNSNTDRQQLKHLQQQPQHKLQPQQNNIQDLNSTNNQSSQKQPSSFYHQENHTGHGNNYPYYQQYYYHYQNLQQQQQQQLQQQQQQQQQYSYQQPYQQQPRYPSTEYPFYNINNHPEQHLRQQQFPADGSDRHTQLLYYQQHRSGSEYHEHETSMVNPVEEMSNVNADNMSKINDDNMNKTNSDNMSKTNAGNCVVNEGNRTANACMSNSNSAMGNSNAEVNRLAGSSSNHPSDTDDEGTSRIINFPSCILPTPRTSVFPPSHLCTSPLTPSRSESPSLCPSSGSPPPVLMQL